MNAGDIARYFLRKEEDRVSYLYNDATGHKVTAQPEGNISIGEGINLENGLDDEEMDLLFEHRLQKFMRELDQLMWYTQLDPIRQYVLIDMAFNGGGVPYILTFKKMVTAIRIQDWETAAKECQVKNPQLKARYSRLAAILLSGKLPELKAA
jgi:hypothetical protein